jgi:hypothetical protein
MTPARQFFFASSIAAGRGGLKPASGSAWRRSPRSAAAGVHGEVPALVEAPPQEVVQSVTTAQPQPLAFSPEGRRREAAGAGMAYGTRLHAALDWLSSGGDAGRSPQGIPAPDWPAFRNAARAILDAPQLQAFFDPARYPGAQRAGLRCPTAGSDRPAGRRRTASVLDYKRPAGAALLETYRAQMEGYRAAVMALYPGKAARCGLVFSDGDMLEI